MAHLKRKEILTAMMLDVQQLSLSLGGHRILQQVSLQAKGGECCVIMGANGAGKSTLMKVLAGEYPHYTGNVRLNGKSLRELTAAEQARQRAVLSQRIQLHLPFTVKELVRMGRYVYGEKVTVDTAIVEYALHTLQVFELRDRAWTTLSGGQQQRVHMARVLAQLLESPQLDEHIGRKILLLDEPVTGMDIRHQQLALQLAATLAQHGVLVVAVLHDFHLAAAWADRIFMLHKGSIYAAGTTEMVLTAANIRHCFEIDVQVLEHPACDHPIIMTLHHTHLSKKIIENGSNYFSA